MRGTDPAPADQINTTPRGPWVVNHPPVIPAACATLPDQTTCTAPGDVVLFTPEFAAATPAGAGVEVVLDRRDRRPPDDERRYDDG